MRRQAEKRMVNEAERALQQVAYDLEAAYNQLGKVRKANVTHPVGNASREAMRAVRAASGKVHDALELAKRG